MTTHATTTPRYATDDAATDATGSPSARGFDRFAGGAAILAGLLTVAFWLVHPRAADPHAARTQAFFDAVASERFQAVNAAFVVLIVCSLFALIALHQRVAREKGRVPLPAFLLAYTGSALFVPLGVFQSGAAPALASDARYHALLAADGPLFAGPFTMFIAVGGLAFAIGYVWLGVEGLRGRLSDLSRGIGAAFVASSPILGFSALMPFEARLVGSTIWGIAFVALGVSLWRGRAAS